MRRYSMSNNNKYVMIGVTTILFPLGKWVLQKVMNKLTEESEQDSAAEEHVESTTAQRQFPRRA